MKIKLSLSFLILFCSASLFGQTISKTGTLTAVSTTYGGPSATPTSFVTGGTSLTANLVITPPTGFEVSSTSATTGYGNSVSLTPIAGSVANTTIYVRLAATTAFGTYGVGGNVAISSTGATTQNVPTVSSSVAKASLTIKAQGVTKTPNTTITGGSGSSSFIATGLQNGETAGTVTITYGAGASAGDPPGTYTNQVSASGLTGGTINANNYNISYLNGNLVVGTSTITVNALLQPRSTTYGTASATTTFTVSGSNLSNNITITPPAGFQIASSSGGPYGNSVTLTESAGGVGTTNNYLRLAASTNVGTNYGGNVVISSPGAASQILVMPTSTVNAAAITITAANATKIYGATLTGGSGSTAFTLTSGSLQNDNTISSLTVAYGSGSAASDVVNTYVAAVTPSAAIGANGFLTSNYAITYGKGNIIVSKAPATVNLDNLAQTYDGSPKPVTASASGATGTSSFTYTYDGSSTEPIQAGTYAVMATLVNSNFSGTASGSLIIAKATQVISFPAFAAKDTASPDFEPGASTNSNLPITYTSSNTAVAEVYQDVADGNKWKVKIKAIGTSDITALQAGNTNYNSSFFLRELTVSPTVLPISLVSYTAKIVNGAAKLEWQTSAEANSEGFIIYRSGDDKLSKVIGELTGEGTSTTLKNYSFIDHYPLSGNNYYSLVQVDHDGKQTNYGEKSLNFKLPTSGAIKVYPTLTANKVTLEFEAGDYNSIELIGYSGTVLEKRKVGTQENSLELSLLTYPSGTYVIRFSGKFSTIKRLIKL